MTKRLEDLLDIEAHTRARWNLTPDDCTWDQVNTGIANGQLVPEFPLWDEAHQEVWAKVAHTLSGGRLSAPDLIETYREIVIRPLQRADDEFAKSRCEAVIWVKYHTHTSCVEWVREPVSPDEMARRCAKVRGTFVIYGGGHHYRGDARGWRRFCRCGEWMCPIHGVPRKNRPQWYDKYDPRLWPWVGVVPGGMRRHRVR